MSNLIEHAKREFLRAGYKPIEECEDGPNKWIQENILELLEVFSKQGHSGLSASYCISYFKKLANFEIISPLKKDQCNWQEIGSGTFQSKTLSSMFKSKEVEQPYYLDAIVWKDQNGITFTGKVDGITSRQCVNFPFYPKTFYIDVIESANGNRTIKDRDQLKEVFEYYTKYEVKKY